MLVYYEVLLDEDIPEKERLIIKIQNELNKLSQELEAEKEAEEDIENGGILEEMDNEEAKRISELYGCFH